MERQLAQRSGARIPDDVRPGLARAIVVEARRHRIEPSLVLAMIVANILLGFLLGFGLLSGLLARNATAKEKSEALIAKLTNVQIPLGLGAMGLGTASFLV